MMPYFGIDGAVYAMPCSIEREAEIRSSELSGLLLDKNYFNDPIGTYMKYTIAVAVPTGQENEYAGLYELLTNPQAEHRVDVPYNQGRKIIKGRIEAVSDRYYHEEDGIHVWRGTKFSIIANEPTKVSEL
jgi:hypothetical protein